jgi:hypothetical protein
MQCIVVNIGERDDWIDQGESPQRKRAIGLHIPCEQRPSLIHQTRDEAEREAARLSCATGSAFAVFELAGIVIGKPMSSADRTRGIGIESSMCPRWLDAPLEI